MCSSRDSHLPQLPILFFFFFFNDTATTEIYTLSLHDALPIWRRRAVRRAAHRAPARGRRPRRPARRDRVGLRSEEHTSELQSLAYLVCRLLLEKKKKKYESSARSRRAARNQHVSTPLQGYTKH